MTGCASSQKVGACNARIVYKLCLLKLNARVAFLDCSASHREKYIYISLFACFGDFFTSYSFFGAMSAKYSLQYLGENAVQQFGCVYTCYLLRTSPNKRQIYKEILAANVKASKQLNWRMARLSKQTQQTTPRHETF